MSYIYWLRTIFGQRKVILCFAAVVLHGGKGRVLLQRRADFDVWGLSGGILERGEHILACARRARSEETGLEAGPLRLVGGDLAGPTVGLAER